MLMTLQEIARDINTSKQNVNQILKRALRKVFKKMKKLNPEMLSFDLILNLAKTLNITKEKDILNFFNDFPADVRQEIENDIKNKNLKIKFTHEK